MNCRVHLFSHLRARSVKNIGGMALCGTIACSDSLYNFREWSFTFPTANLRCVDRISSGYGEHDVT